MCLHPFVIDGQTLPCGKCVECRKARRNSHFVALYFASLKYKDFYFWTLTYDNDHVPKLDDGILTLRRKDVQDWFKRCRRDWEYHNKDPLDFKYWFIGEYGSQTKRPHYHGITFGLDYKQVAQFASHWKNGFFSYIKIKSVDGRQNVIRYILKYILKGYFDFDLLPDGVELPRVQQSINLVQLDQKLLDWFTGADLGVTLNDYVDFDTALRIHDRRHLVIGDFTYQLSKRYVQKYFKQKLEKVDWWTGEVKTSVVNTPLQDSIASALQLKHAYLRDEELHQYQDAIQTGLLASEASQLFSDSFQAREDRRRVGERELRKVIASDKF